MLDTDISRSSTLHPPQLDAGTIDLKVSGSAMSRMIDKIQELIGHAHPQPQEAIGRLLSECVQNLDLLANHDLPPSGDRYARHVLYRGGDFSVLALVWRPGQMSAVHSHRTWGALAVHRGSLTEALFRRGPQGIECLAARRLSPPAFSHASPEAPVAHRIANLGVGMAVSLHVYGTGCNVPGDDVNNVWAD